MTFCSLHVIKELDLGKNGLYKPPQVDYNQQHLKRQARKNKNVKTERKKTEMADRRCISKDIYNTRKFLELPCSTRDLYTYLVLNTDIDGVVEAFQVMKSIGASINDLRLLDELEFVKVLNDDWVTYISNFTSFNTLDGRGRKGSIYRELLVQVVPNVKLTQLAEKKSKKNKNEEKVSHGNPKGVTCITQSNTTQLNPTQRNTNTMALRQNYGDIAALENEILSN